MISRNNRRVSTDRTAHPRRNRFSFLKKTWGRATSYLRATDSFHVLIDTNVFMAARWKTGGFGYRVVKKAAEGRLPLRWCRDQKEEAFRMVDRVRPGPDFLSLVTKCFPEDSRVEAGPRKEFGAGRVDDILIGCCLANRVDVLITSDKQLTSVARREGVVALNPARFCEQYPRFFYSSPEGETATPSPPGRFAQPGRFGKFFRTLVRKIGG